MNQAQAATASDFEVRPVPFEPVSLAKVYVWEWPVRVSHWATALSLFILAISGYYLGNPFIIAAGPAGGRFVMGTMKAVHFYAAIVFTLSVLSRIVWMFVGNKYATWDKFIPVRKIRLRGIVPTLQFYLLGRKPPGFVGHNPLAGLTYSLVILLFLLQIVTGLALYSASAHVDSPLRVFGFLVPWLGGLQTARFVHHVVMWLLLGFTVHHIHSAVMVSQMEQNATVESIVSGYKFVPRDDLVYSGYRYFDQRTVRGG